MAMASETTDPSGVDDTTPQAMRRSARREMLRLALMRVALLFALLAFWEFASGRLVPEFFISSPSKIFARFWRWVQSGDIFFHASITATEAVLGFMIGSVIGIAVGLLLGRNEFLARLLDPFIMTIYSLPKIALAPLFILWIGIGLDMKVIFTAVIVFFLVFLNTYTGVRNVSRELISIIKLMGARERQVVQKVVLPSAIAWVFAGLRISVPYALMGAVVGELMASNRGLGSLLVRAQGEFDTAGVFAALIAIMVLAVFFNGLVRIAERRLMPWVRVQNEREGAV